jgi:RNA polymerase sigma-70 factor, ECF subfamily
VAGSGLADPLRLDEASLVAYRPRLVAFLRSRGATPEMAEDLTQTLLARVLQSEMRLRDLRFPAERARDVYILRAAENLWTDWRRREQRQPTESLEPAHERGDDSPVPAPSALATPPVALDALLEAERRERLRAAIDELPPKMRQCVILRVYQDRSLKEIALLLRIDRNTVKSHLGTAKKELKQRLGGEFGKIDLDDEDRAP